MSIKRNELIRHLEIHSCYLKRNGAKHDLYSNVLNSKQTTIPRHPKIDKHLCEAICEQLGIEKI
ncbi:type II toxin-antitoxin system HicA family toxin [Dyadobacter fanqingshengii]|uniref:type II toxin-antitoxin system HicA family toxin n=1 Tax=Dyadobacter fanqingshengii TaxID=2906443 RepID=UPI0035B58807